VTKREPSKIGVDRERVEDWRQLEHMVPLFVAFLLPYINRPILLGIGAVGIAYACWLSRLLAPTTIRPEEQDRIPRAKLYYALSALCLLLIFMDRPYIGAAGFAVLAVGDAMSNLVGRKMGGRRMPYNSGKTVFGSLSFWMGGSLAAWALMIWNEAPNPPHSTTVLLLFAVIGSLVCALVESLPPIVDDNLLITWVAGVIFFLLFRLDTFAPRPASNWVWAIALTAGGVLIVWVLGWLKPGAALLAAALGVAFSLGTGVAGIMCMGAFVALASLVSRKGCGTPRDSLSVISKGVVAALIAVYCVFGSSQFMLVAFAAAAAAATCDTAGTELGMRYGRRTLALRTLARVTPGTPGGISLVGTLGGWAFATLIAAIPLAVGWYPLRGVLVVSLAALAASCFESLLKSDKGEDSYLEASFNIWNTFFAAFMAGWIWYFYTG